MAHELRKVLIELVAGQDPLWPDLFSSLFVGEGGDRAGLGPSVVTGEDEHGPRILREKGGEVQFLHDAPHVRRAVAAGPEGPHQGPHARPYDAHDGDAILLQRLDDTNVSKALGPPSGEGQNDPSVRRAEEQNTQHQRTQAAP